MSGQHAGNHSNTTLHEAVVEARADVVQVLIAAGADIEKRDTQGCTPLLLACVRGCLGTVKVLVQAGVEVRVTNWNDDTCLIAASREGHTETVRYLVGLGQDVDNVGGWHATTALHEAVGKNHADVVQVLIDAGADIEKEESEGLTPLLLACMEGSLDTVKVLVQADAEVRVTDRNRDTCLIAASREGHTETVRYLVGLGQVDVDQVGGWHATTALHEAVGKHHADVVQVLIDAGADIEKEDSTRRTPLLRACVKGCLDTVKVLVQAGAELRVAGADGDTCLIAASREGHTETVRYLVGLGQVDVDQVGGRGANTSLHRAQNHADVVQVLIDAGADIEKENSQGYTPLLFACVKGFLDTVKVLVQAGAELRVAGADGDTCLIAASREGHTETVRYLVGLEQVDVDQEGGPDATTALHEAVDKNHADVVQVLIDAGADIEKRDSVGRTPLILACVRGCLDAVKVLVQAGAELRVTDSNDDTCLITVGTENNFTALLEAVGKNHAAVVQVLIDAGADIEEEDSDGCTPLVLACMEGFLHIVKVLVQAGAELRVTDSNGDTCLIAASREGHTETVRYLVGLGQVDVNQVGGPDTTTALHRAVGKNQPADVVQVLIDAGADIEEKDALRRSPLLLGCKSDVNDAVKVLIRAGADVGARDRDGRTCLMIASARGFTEIVKSLLCMAEVGVDLVDAEHWTALHHAVRRKRAPAIQMLIDAGADVEAKSELVCSPLMMACRAGEVHIVRMLLEAGARLHIQGNGNIRFDAAARYPKSYEAKVQELIDSGAHIEKWDDRGPSPLVCACMGKNRDIVKLLVEAGAELRVTEHIEELSQHFEAAAGDRKEHKIQKVTCLITAAEEGGTETVRYLMVGVEQSKKRLREKLEPIRAAWEHMATSLSAPELPLVAAEVVT